MTDFMFCTTLPRSADSRWTAANVDQEQQSFQNWHPLWPREKWSVLSGQEICVNMFRYLNVKIAKNELMENNGKNLNAGLLMFDSASDKYPITLLDYMKRIVHYMRAVCSPVVQVGCVLLIERLERAGYKLTDKNVYRIFSVAYFIAYKVIEDEPHLVNSKIAQIAGMPVSELVALETAFCKSIEFNLGIDHDLDIQRMIVDRLLPPDEIGIDENGSFFRQCNIYARTPSTLSFSDFITLSAAKTEKEQQESVSGKTSVETSSTRESTPAPEPPPYHEDSPWSGPSTAGTPGLEPVIVGVEGEIATSQSVEDLRKIF